MKQLLWGSALAVLVAACGGGSKPPPTEPQPQPKSACAAAAEHSIGVLTSSEEARYTADQSAGFVRVLTERCETDKWPDDAVACLTGATTGDDLVGCGEMLSEEQQKATTDQLEREKLLPGEDAEKAMEAPGDDAKPPPAPPPPDDPCGGGA